MNQLKFEPSLETVFDDLLLALEREENPFGAAHLQRWTNKFPQFAGEIREFFVTQAMHEILPEAEISAAEASRFAANFEIENISSLQKSAEKIGLKFSQLAGRVGLSLTLLGNLEQRFALFHSIPAEIVDNLAAVLQTSAVAVAAYLQQPPQLVSGANYKAAGKPEIPKQEDFFNLVRQDRMLTNEQKENLLKLAAKTD